MNIEKQGNFVLKEDPTFKIGFKFVLYDPDDIGDIYFAHPLTGQWNERLENVFVGWSEQNLEDNEKWQELKKRIETFLNTDIWDQIILDGQPNIILGSNSMSDIETTT